MAPNYSANLQKFIDNYKSFEGELDNYTTQLDEFYNQVNTLLAHASSRDTTTSKITVEGRKYLKTKNGLLIAMNPNNRTTDFSSNKLNDIGGNNYFYVDPQRMTSSDVSFGSGNYKEGEIIQGGLGDLSYDENDLKDVSFVKLIPNTYPKIDAIRVNNCKMDDVYLCSSYAKMNDKPYFGLARVDYKDGTSKCSCYIFDDVEGIPDNEIVIGSANINDSSLNGISYLGIMFDNTFCSLKESNYSGNFEGIYNEDMDKINEIDITNRKYDCNKFTGSGMYNISIDSLNSNTNSNLKCAMKQKS